MGAGASATTTCTAASKMSWYGQDCSFKSGHVYSKPASKENCYNSVAITHNTHDNHFCVVNPDFIVVVTECTVKGPSPSSPLHQMGKLDPHYPEVCGHRGNILGIK